MPSPRKSQNREAETDQRERAGFGHALASCAPLAFILLTLADRTVAASGDLDPTFGDGGRVVLTQLAQLSPADSVALQADGKIVLVSTIHDDRARRVLTRLNADGSLDASFGSGGVVMGTQPDETARDVIQQADGKLVVVGDVRGHDAALWRFGSGGALDPSFGTGGLVTLDLGASERASKLLQQADGKLVIAGVVEDTSDGSQSWMLARFNGDGSVDTAFGSGGTLIVELPDGDHEHIPGALLQQADGRLVLVASRITDVGGALTVARVTTAGAVDLSLGSDGTLLIAADEIRPVPAGHTGVIGRVSAALQNDGRILIVGRAGDFVCCDDWGDPTTRGAGFLLRLEPNAAIDLTFGTSGVSTRPPTFSSVVIQSDGKIVAAFSDFDNMGVMRFAPDGSTDDSFGIAGRAIADFGSQDQTPIYQAEDMIQQPDGKFVVVGSYAVANSNLGWYPAIARFGQESTGFPGLIGFTYSPVFAAENQSTTITVRRTGGSTGAVGVDFETIVGSATDGSDYTSQIGQLDWVDGDTSEKTITLTVINDAIEESGDAEQFGLRLMNPTGGARLTLSATTISILDDDSSIDPPPEPPPSEPPMPSDSGGGGGSADVLLLVLLLVGVHTRRRRSVLLAASR